MREKLKKSKRIIFLLFLIIFLNDCSKTPEINVLGDRGEGHFVGILHPRFSLFVPMEFLLTNNFHVDKLTPFSHFAYDCIAVKYYFDKNFKRPEILTKYKYYFVIVKGEYLKGNPEEFTMTVFQFRLRIDEIVFLKVVDSNFFKCLLNKEVAGKQFKYFKKHPTEILKLCQHKPLDEIKEKDNSVERKGFKR